MISQLKKAAKNKQVKNILSKMLNKIELLGPLAGNLLDSKLHIYEIKNMRPPIRLYYKIVEPKKEAIYSYELTSLNNVSKVRFVYILKGRKDENGLIKKLGGRFLVPGCFIIPRHACDRIEELFKFWNVKFQRFDVCVSKEEIDYVY